MGITEIVALLGNGMLVLAYFFNPKLREERDRAKTWAIFHDLEEKLAAALLAKDMYLVDNIRHWLQEMREKYEYIKEKK